MVVPVVAPTVSAAADRVRAPRVTPVPAASAGAAVARVSTDRAAPAEATRVRSVRRRRGAGVVMQGVSGGAAVILSPGTQVHPFAL
ncbi:hypothetical protein GCM10009528_03840 [Kineococcus aurantiacus]